MPLSPFTQVQSTDILNSGREKYNLTLELIRVFLNTIETRLDALNPTHINGLLVGGKINPIYLQAFITDVQGANVTVADAGNNFTSSNLEGVLVELFNLASSAQGGGGGASWFTGSGAPSGAVGDVGDFYLRSDTADFYEKTGASTWTLRGNLKGAAGAAGPTGPAGATGPGVQTGGLTGQVLVKNSSTNYDTSWQSPNTTTVIYNAGWPSTRPNATHVYAIGHSAPPSWLTSVDVWLQEV